MKAHEIRELMIATGAKHASLAFVLDREYLLPSADYIRGDFAKWFWEEQYRRGVATWNEESNDCDNFSVRAFADIGLAHALTSPASKTGIAFGLFFYSPDGTLSYHAIACAVVRGIDGVPHVVFFEPQPKASAFGLVALTGTEIESCLGYLFC